MDSIIVDNSLLDTLNYLQSHGIIDIDVMRDKVEDMKRKEYLEMHPYTIWQGKNDKWYTYLPDDIKGRKLCKKSSQKDLENCIVSYWRANSEEGIKEEKAKHLTLLKLFPMWLEYKELHTRSSSTISRILADWKRFYVNETELINKPIRKLDRLYLDEWAHRMIRQYNMTKVMYYNMSLIIRQALEYAKDAGFIEENIFKSVKINTKLFRRVKKKSGITEVYSVEEQPLLIKDMIRRFENNPQNTAPIAVMLLFEVGVRIGELCALKFEDIHGNYITIQRQEVRVYKRIGKYDTKFDHFEIVDYVKSEDGYRDIYLTDTARKLINLAEKMNIVNQENNPEGFIFCNEGKNITHYSIQAMLLRGCKAIGIKTKTAHKIRKTYISTLIDSGLNIDRIRRMAGHSDERTTYNNYCYDRMTDNESELILENALNAKKVIKSNHFLEMMDNPESLDFAKKTG